MWEQLLPPDKRGLPPQSTVQKATPGSARDGGTRAQHTRIRSRSTSVEPRKSLVFFFPLTHLRMMEGGGKRERERDGKGLLGRRRLAADQSSIASS